MAEIKKGQNTASGEFEILAKLTKLAKEVFEDEGLKVDEEYIRSMVITVYIESNKKPGKIIFDWEINVDNAFKNGNEIQEEDEGDYIMPKVIGSVLDPDDHRFRYDEYEEVPVVCPKCESANINPHKEEYQNMRNMKPHGYDKYWCGECKKFKCVVKVVGDNNGE